MICKKCGHNNLPIVENTKIKRAKHLTEEEYLGFVYKYYNDIPEGHMRDYERLCPFGLDGQLMASKTWLEENAGSKSRRITYPKRYIINWLKKGLDKTPSTPTHYDEQA